MRATKDTGRFTILHTNDLHGHIAPWRGWEGALTGKTIGGIDRIAAVVSQVRDEVGAKNTLLLDAGDVLGDTLIAQETKGDALFTFLNRLHYDAITLGNHEPDFGVTVLQRHRQQARFPILAANVRTRATRDLFTAPHLLREVGGVIVGVIGIAYTNTPLTTAAKNVEGLIFEDGIQAARREARALRKKGAGIVVALSHLGLSADQNLARSVPGLDVIVGGHSHNRMEKAQRVGNTLIVQAGAHGSDVGRLDITVEKGKVTHHRRVLTLLDNAIIPANPTFTKLLQSLLAPHEAKAQKHLGKAGGPLVRAQTLAGQAPHRRDAESPVDSLFADILREATGSDIAFLPGVGYGIAIAPGDITVAALRNLVPHDAAVFTMTLTGLQVQQILEQSVENVLTDDYRKKVGGMIQVGGLTFTYDPEASFGKRVQSITVQGTALDFGRRYLTATNALLAAGGHRYKTFREGTNPRERGVQHEIIAAAILRKGMVAVPSGGRIQKAEQR